MKKEKLIKVYDVDEDWRKPIPFNLNDHIAWLQSIREKIPDEHRNAAYISMNADSSYGCPSLEYRISYSRLETDEEELARETAAKRVADEQRQSEIAKLMELQAKYADEISKLNGAEPHSV